MAATPVDAGRIPTRPVWLVMGQTTRPLDCECTVVPGHDGHTDGRYFLVLLNVTTHQLVAGASLLTDRPDLKKLGTPVVLGE